jgi:cytochrome c556
MMVRKFAMAVAMMVAIGFTMSSSAQDKKDEKKVPSVKEVMKKVNGKMGLCAKCGELSKGEKWEDALKTAKELNEYGEAMGKNKPKKGEAESWEKLTKTYAEQTGAILKAIEAKDSAKTKEAIGTFTKACKTCHDAHK